MTDPSISLAVRPPADPLQEYSKALAIKNQMQQQQVGQQQLQSGALTIQQQQMELDMRKRMATALQDTDNDWQKYQRERQQQANVPLSGTPPAQPSNALPAAPPAGVREQGPGAGESGDTPAPDSAMAGSDASGIPTPAPPAQPSAIALSQPPSSLSPPIQTSPAAAPDGNGAVALSRPTLAVSLASPAPPATTSPDGGNGASGIAASGPASNRAAAPERDYNSFLIDNMRRRGVSAAGMKPYVDLGISIAKESSDRTAAQRDIAAQATSILGGIFSLDDPQQRADQYKKFLPQLRNIEQRLGSSDALPPVWNDQTEPTMKVLMARGTAIAEQYAHQNQLAETMIRQQQGFNETAPKAAQYMESQIAALGSLPPDAQARGYQALRNQISSWAQQPGGKVWQTVLDNHPRAEKYTPDMARDAQMAVLSPKERTEEFKRQLNEASQVLRAAAANGGAQYNGALATVLTRNPEFTDLFPKMWKNGDSWDAKAMQEQAAQVGQTGEQYITATNLKGFREQTAELRERLADIRERMAGLAEKKFDQSPQAVTAQDQELMNKVWTDTRAMNPNATPADAVAFLRDPERWGDNPDVSARRLALIGMFQKANKADLDAANEQARIDAAKNKLNPTDTLMKLSRQRAWMKAHPNQGIPTDEQLAADATPPQKTAVPSKPARMRVRLSDGRTGQIDTTDFDPKTMTRLP